MFRRASCANGICVIDFWMDRRNQCGAAGLEIARECGRDTRSPLLVD